MTRLGIVTESANNVGKNTGAELEPVDVNGIAAVKIGTLVWLIATIISIPFNGWLDKHGIHYATAICISGVILGLLGTVYTKRRANKLAISKG